MACAWACYHSRCTDIQRRAGFDGWVAILEGPYDTDDQAWPQEQQRIRLAARSLTRHAESRRERLRNDQCPVPPRSL
eukprot:6173358-Pleurochrysis_carterae.AAC.1